MATSSVTPPFLSTLQLLKFSTPTETYVSPYSVQPVPSVIGNGSNDIHESAVPTSCTEQDGKSGSSASQSTNIVNGEQFINQCPPYGPRNPSDNGLDSIDVLSQSRSEPSQEIVQPLVWNTLATDTMDNDALSYGFSMPNDALGTSWSSVKIGLAIRERKPIVLDGEKYWIVEWERSYIHESETFGVHWDLFMDHESTTSMFEPKRPGVSKRKPGRPRKSASSRFSKKATTLKPRKAII